MRGKDTSPIAATEENKYLLVDIITKMQNQNLFGDAMIVKVVETYPN